jgi:hypothetical protein
MGKGEPDAAFKNLIESQGKLMQTTKGGQKKAEAKVKALGDAAKPNTGP